MTLQVATTRTVTTESGNHVIRTVVRYKRQVRGIADKHGQFTKGIRIDYKPVRPERLVVVVTVHMAHGIATGRVSATILPLHHRFARGSQPSAPIDGISCQAELLNYHIHAHLTLYKDGQPVSLPAQIGIPYSRAIGGQHYCLYWLHTHDASGVIHIESPTPRLYTLGQFFDIWQDTSLWDAQGGLAGPAGLVVDASFVKALRSAKPGAIHVFIDGQPVSRDYRRLPLTKHKLITIEIGTPLKPPTTHYDFSAVDK